MTITIGIVGTGNFSEKHARILAEMGDVNVKAFCGTSKQKADRIASEFSAKGYDNFDDMLDSTKLDAVYLCVPPMAHGQMEMELIKRNIPFFVEKPLGVDKEIPGAILAEVKKKSLLTSVGYHFRYSESVQRMKQVVGSQTIGMISGQWVGDMPGVYWWRNQDLSGGQFNEQTTHIVDILRYLAGEVDEVHAFFGNRIMHEKAESVTVADVGTVNLKFQNGIIANVSNACISPSGQSSVGVTVYTNQGNIDWKPTVLRMETGNDKATYNDTTDPYFIENQAFINALRTGDASLILSDYEDAFKTQQVTSAAVESAVSGRTIIL
ncbi:Gfo/Idh/MocA family protein [Aquibacillus rhizosphaerae]|uniref:Gfo/Idh/MocA family oxidoreductase n=1 Tax=Aquibacillus rhizosphaerae TaxID=3051431 RepID=A0ABT7L862_9BACI|nr:Gfo/Idh/MocA family oxidoreductase [Aquibacillus sp. LR5S19]MDL4842058.1 Gfo/Idh/MocA family oxidoreductase [Aquibacillus sp. LR5S19]